MILKLDANNIDLIIAHIGVGARKFTNSDNGHQAVLMSAPDGGDPFYFRCDEWAFTQLNNGECSFSNTSIEIDGSHKQIVKPAHIFNPSPTPIPSGVN